MVTDPGPTERGRRIPLSGRRVAVPALANLAAVNFYRRGNLFDVGGEINGVD